jgi:phosphate transport system substrate-binding protein
MAALPPGSYAASGRRGRSRARALLGLALLGLAAPAARAEENLPPRVLRAVGSDVLAPLVERWGRALESAQPGLHVEVLGPGSQAAPAALVRGEAELGPMGRPMTPDERAAFESRFGYRPTVVPVVVGALFVLVAKSNPLPSLTVQQLDAIYSRERSCGAPAPLVRWSELGVARPRGQDRIVPCGRDRRSGTREFLRWYGLCQGEFGDAVLEQPGTRSLERAVAEGFCGIGYSGLPPADAEVRAVPLSGDPDEPPVAPTPEAIATRRYPLAQELTIVLDVPPGGAPGPDVAAFLRLALSPQGQAMAREFDLLPLPEPERAAQAAKLR